MVNSNLLNSTLSVTNVKIGFVQQKEKVGRARIVWSFLFKQNLNKG